MITYEEDICVNCFLCYERCPMGVFAKYNNKLYLPEANKELCVGCGICIDVCPMSCITWDYSYNKLR